MSDEFPESKLSRRGHGEMEMPGWKVEIESDVIKLYICMCEHRGE